MISLGFAIRALAISNSLRCPPDKLPANSWAMWSILKRSSSSSALVSICCSWVRHNGLMSPAKMDSPRWSKAPSFMFSSTESRVRALVSWKVLTMPALANR